MKKKTEIKDFNKEFFNDYKKIKSIIPRMIDWTDEEGDFVQKVIEEIEIEFENGERIIISPYSNQDNVDDENLLSLALNIFVFKKELVKIKK